MINFVDSDIKNNKSDSVKGQVSKKFVDIHCHCLPGLDDGPDTISEAVSLCQALATEGISIVAATPHQLGRYEGQNRAAEIRSAVYELNEILRGHGISIKLVPGGEVRVDERICRLLEADEILTIADNSRYILLELPHQIFIDIEPLLKELASVGISVVVAHAERIKALVKRPDILHRWLEHSVCLQITASSVLGFFGTEAEKYAWDILASGRAVLVATDSHDIDSRRPEMKAAFRHIAAKLGEDIAQRVCIENPLKVIKGLNISSLPLYSRMETK